MIVKQSWHHYLDISLGQVKINRYINNKNVINELVDDYLRKERAEREAQQHSGKGVPPDHQKYEDGVVYLSEDENEDEDESSSSERSSPRRSIPPPASALRSFYFNELFY
jgi:hypothetical protein